MKTSYISYIRMYDLPLQQQKRKWPNYDVKLFLCSTALGHQMPVLGGYIWSEILNLLCIQCILHYIVQNVKMTLCSTAVADKMPVLGGTSYLKFWTTCVCNLNQCVSINLLHISIIVTVSFCSCSSLIVHSLLEMNNNKFTQ